jgi:alkylation response protein AidB-like acyl-CoA dehydrogenase
LKSKQLQLSREISGLLNGQKVFVIDGASADLILIVARTSGKKGESNGLSVFIADKNSMGLEDFSNFNSRLS